MDNHVLIVLLVVLPFLVAQLVYPFTLRFAIRHHVLDCPNERKRQRIPVPVMGGLTVYAGVVVGTCIAYLFLHDNVLFVMLAFLTVMMLIGLWDDLKDLQISLRFVLEFLIVWMVMVTLHLGIDNFYGLWGVSLLPPQFYIPLSLIAGVGIINAINLMDGVDGYSSSYGIMTCTLFAVFFYHVGNYTMMSMAIVMAAALIPFLFHNVFGWTSKMYIGDSGTLMLGMLMTLMVFSVLTTNNTDMSLVGSNFSPVAFTLSLLSMPVFDTLRLMLTRIRQGKPLFRSDRSHLHHLYIEMNFSHVGATFCIMCRNMFVILAWFASWQLGASVDVQFYVVVVLSILFTLVFYNVMRMSQRADNGRGNRLYHFWCRMGDWTHMRRMKWWFLFRQFVDKPCLSGHAGQEYHERMTSSVTSVAHDDARMTSSVSPSAHDNARMPSSVTPSAHDNARMLSSVTPSAHDDEAEV